MDVVVCADVRQAKRGFRIKILTTAMLNQGAPSRGARHRQPKCVFLGLWGTKRSVAGFSLHPVAEVYIVYKGTTTTFLVVFRGRGSYS